MRICIPEVQHIIDASENKIAVVAPIDEYNEVLEEPHDLAVIAERRNEPTVSFEGIKKRLKERGVL